MSTITPRVATPPVATPRGTTKRVVAALILAMSGVAGTALPAPALPAPALPPPALPAPSPPAQAITSKRQFLKEVSGCMKKRMSADRMLSYYQAARDCRDYVTRQLDGPKPAPLVASDVKH